MRTAAAARADAGLPVRVAPPARVRAFATALGRLAKTDALDAAVLVEFAERVPPDYRPLPPPATQELQALLARRRQVVGMRTMELNRLQQATSPAVRASIAAVLAVLDTQVAEAERAVTEAIAADPVWAAKDEALRRVCGVGAVVSRTLPCWPTCQSWAHSPASRRRRWPGWPGWPR